MLLVYITIINTTKYNTSHQPIFTGGLEDLASAAHGGCQTAVPWRSAGDGSQERFPWNFGMKIHKN
jgi:hypothetical protein